MSRIGKKPILIPQGVTFRMDGNTAYAKGAKGELSRVLDPRVKIETADGQILVSAASKDKFSRAMWGTVRMHLANLIEGAQKGFIKQLQVEGIGYRAAVEGKTLVLQVGFTHPVRIDSNEVDFKVEKNIITVSGIDKENVSKIAAQIKRVRPPEPYKGKGIRYVGEVIRKKVGKKAATGAAK